MVVRLGSENVHGWGESLTHPDEKAQALLAELIGQDATRLDGLLRGPWQDLQPWIREPFSMALYDLVCRVRNIPLTALISGRRRASVPLMPCLFPCSAAEAGQLAEKWTQMGFKHLKTKIIGQRKQDVAIVRSIRRALGKDCHLQADANPGYKSLPLAKDTLDELYTSGLDCIEDPLAGSLEEIAQLRRQVKIPIMLDGPARSLPDIAEIDRPRAAAVVNLHPCQQGTVSELIARDAMLMQSMPTLMRHSPPAVSSCPDS